MSLLPPPPHPPDSREAKPSRTPIRALLYTGTTDNPNFSMSPSVEDAAAIIASAVGPSGPNSEYLLALWEYLEKVSGVLRASSGWTGVRVSSGLPREVRASDAVDFCVLSTCFLGTGGAVLGVVMLCSAGGSVSVRERYGCLLRQGQGFCLSGRVLC